MPAQGPPLPARLGLQAPCAASGMTATAAWGFASCCCRMNVALCKLPSCFTCILRESQLKACYQVGCVEVLATVREPAGGRAATKLRHYPTQRPHRENSAADALSCICAKFLRYLRCLQLSPESPPGNGPA